MESGFLHAAAQKEALRAAADEQKAQAEVQRLQREKVELDNATKTDPSNPTIWYRRAQLYRARGLDSDAAAFLKQARAVTFSFLCN
eukprot:SAG31_NODE_7411_length_1696_cov_1.681277_1_plen_86_part_00